MRTLLLVLVFTMTLCACGYRTPLTLPPAKPAAPSTPPVQKPPAAVPEPAPSPAT